MGQEARDTHLCFGKGPPGDQYHAANCHCAGVEQWKPDPFRDPESAEPSDPSVPRKGQGETKGSGQVDGIGNVSDRATRMHQVSSLRA